jgi:hypothetical protein
MATPTRTMITRSMAKMQLSENTPPPSKCHTYTEKEKEFMTSVDVLCKVNNTVRGTCNKIQIGLQIYKIINRQLETLLAHNPHKWLYFAVSVLKKSDEHLTWIHKNNSESDEYDGSVSDDYYGSVKEYVKELNKSNAFLIPYMKTRLNELKANRQNVKAQYEWVSQYLAKH